MMDLTRQQKQEALDALIKKLGEGQVPVQPDSIPMEAAPMDEMTPEKAAELEKGRSPASVKPSVADLTGKSDMVAVPLESYMPAGSYVGQKLGQQVSPDVTGTQSAPEVERLGKLKEMIISGRNPSSIEDQPTINQLKKFNEGQTILNNDTGLNIPSESIDVRKFRKIQEEYKNKIDEGLKSGISPEKLSGYLTDINDAQGFRDYEYDDSKNKLLEYLKNQK